MAKKKSKAAGVAEALKESRGEPVKRVPTTGQSAPPRELALDLLNPKELKVLNALNGAGSGVRPVTTIAELAAACFKSQGKQKSNSWTRNSLRRLVQAGFVEKVRRGKYRVSTTGRKQLARAA